MYIIHKKHQSKEIKVLKKSREIRKKLEFKLLIRNIIIELFFDFLLLLFVIIFLYCLIILCVLYYLE
jgi:pilus assembly protein TadC